MGEASSITIGLALAIGGGIAALWWRMQAGFDDERTARMALKDELSTYKLMIAKDYVSATALQATEIRLLSTLDKLTARMEMLIARVETLTLDMAKRAL